MTRSARTRVGPKLGAFVAASVLVLTGCGSATSGDGNKDADIAVGALVPLTGGGAEFGPRMERAIRIAVDEVNAAGGVNGSKLKLFVEDGQTEPDAAVRGAQKLINVNRVHAILGTWSSAVTLAVAPLAIQSNVVQMNTSGANAITDLKDNNLVWRFQPPARLTGSAVANAAIRNNWKTAVAMARNDPSGTSTVESFTKDYEKLGGKVVKTITYAPNQSSYATEVRDALAGGADFIFNSTYAPELAVMVKEAAASSSDVPWLAPGWAVNKAFISAVGGPAADGTYAVDSAPNVEGQAYQNFQKAYQDRHDGALDPSDTYVFSSYDMVVVLALAMTDCSCQSGKELTDSIAKVTSPSGTEVTSFADGIEALKAGQDIDYQGASSNLDFDANGDQVPLFGTYVVNSGKVTLDDSYELK
ncbi:MAG TPA: ABC transporter substrate-binding protein [Mycobacteriales bacterium]|jgi:ABC-type branched-chain amino acid transport systems, periplasmic component